jgi:hypothetical protein
LKEELKQEREKHLEARQRVERLGQERTLLQQEHNQLTEELKRKREQHLEVQWRAERLKQENLLLRQEQRQLVEELEQEREQRLDAQRRAERFGQERMLLQQEHHQLTEELKKKREQHLEAQWRAEQLGQERMLLRQEQGQLTGELEQERAKHLEAQQRAERLRQEWLLLRQEQRLLAEELEQERAKHLEAQQRAWQEHEGRERERSARRDAERRVDHLERELQELREAQQESSSPVLEGLSGNLMETHEFSGEESLATQKSQGAGGTRRPASSPGSRTPETTASEPVEDSPEDKELSLGAWPPHPDDNVNRGRASEEQTHARSDAPVKMDHKHYDKYLENYQGYVELAEKLYRMRKDGEVPRGSPAELKWKKSLRRVHEGIERTTTKLDMLEERNPELATDDRVSRRASLAERQSKLGK